MIFGGKYPPWLHILHQMDLPFDGNIPAILQEMLSIIRTLKFLVSLHARVLPPWLQIFGSIAANSSEDNVQKEFFLLLSFSYLTCIKFSF